jgi:glycosyltransferase involved in cell wall biosynthesis
VKNKKNIWYFGLEPIKSRYTHQLSTQWIPDTFKKYNNDYNFKSIDGVYDKTEQIKVGYVLDAVGRGKYSLSQCSNFLNLIESGEVKEGDIVYFQDFWTPGIESIFYALDLYGIKLKFYTRVWAQSVDEYDFTYQMENWMRGFEIGIDRYLSGIFVGSTIHKEQLRNAGFKSPIHVLSLPVHNNILSDFTINKKTFDGLNKKNKTVVFSSRLDKEKNPFFMLKCAEVFLDKYKDWEWHVTTSANEFRSNIPGFVSKMKEFAIKNNRFKILDNLTKKDYYNELNNASIQFNSSLQDYVSFTAIESTFFNCDVVYPLFRSFPDFLPQDRMYQPFNIDSAISVFDNAINNLRTHDSIFELSNMGIEFEAYIMINNIKSEFNIWHESVYIKDLLTNKI